LRSWKQVRAFNNAFFPGIAEQLEYDIGNHRFTGLRPSLADLTDVGECSATVRAWCPEVVDYYESLTRRRGPGWRLAPELPRAELSDDVAGNPSNQGAADSQPKRGSRAMDSND
jgi:hypothetical protein